MDIRDSQTPMADGVLEMREDGKAVVRFERRLDHPVDRVWAALTTPAEMIRWWGDARVELVEGGAFTVAWLNVDDAGNRAVMTGRVTSLRPPNELEIDGDVHGTLRWELHPDGDGTRLRFTSVLDLPEEFRARNMAGWHFHLDALATTLDGGEVDLVDIRVDDDVFGPRIERYAARLA
jgi:uncharacterized protein YndB with AHSA1/START domain